MQTTTYQGGATDVSVLLKAFTTATGAIKTDITHATSGLELRYKRGATGAVTTITAATQTSTGAHSDGGIVHLHGGVYRVDLPDAAVAASVPWVVVSAVLADTTFTTTMVEIVAGDPRAAAITTAQIIAAEIAAMDGFTSTDTALTINAVAHTITRNDTDGYIASVVAD